MSSSTDARPGVEPPTELMRSLPRAAYLSAEQFARETEGIFHHEWFLAAREDELDVAGACMRVDVTGESILIVRARTGELHGFHNVCRHRGAQLLDETEGGSHSVRLKGSIRCPYHAWTYGLDGALRNAPFLTESDGLCRDQLGLYPVAVETWGGFVFVNLTPEEVTAERSLGSTLAAVMARTANYPLAALRTVETISYDVPANWKVIVENYNECYHCGAVHPELCEVVPAFRASGGRELDWEAGIPHREGATTFTFSGTTDRAPFTGLSDAERTRHKGELVYPNLMLSLSADHVVAFTLRPIDAGHTRIECSFLFHPDEIAKPTFDPSDAIAFWDLVNCQDWRICASVQRGMSSRAFRYGYYAPMEDQSLDIRRYLAEKLGSASVDGSDGETGLPS